jgi:hypothetical protein
MVITSRSLNCKVARDLGLELLSTSIGECPSGPCGSAKWRVPEGLLSKISSLGEPETGWTHLFEVTSGPHAGRQLVWYSGSAHFQPILKWKE